MTLEEYQDSQRIGPVEASRQLGVNYCTYYKWLKAKVIPRRPMMLKIQDWSKGQVTPNDFILTEEKQS